jgi:hypothetical protein
MNTRREKPWLDWTEIGLIGTQKERDETRRYRKWVEAALLGTAPRERLSQQERDEAERFALRQRREQQALQAEIDKLEKRGGVTDNELMGLGLFRLQGSPAIEFNRTRIKQLMAAGLPFEKAAQQALVDLVASDTPLDAYMRQLIAGELRRLYLPDKQRKRHDREAKAKVKVMAADELKHHLMVCGMTQHEAEAKVIEEIGEALGVTEFASIDRMRQRAKKLRRTKN